MYGLSHYVMALQEVEKARLEYRTRKVHEDKVLPPDRHGTTRSTSRHVTKAPLRRLRRTF